MQQGYALSRAGLLWCPCAAREAAARRSACRRQGCSWCQGKADNVALVKPLLGTGSIWGIKHLCCVSHGPAGRRWDHLQCRRRNFAWIRARVPSDLHRNVALHEGALWTIASSTLTLRSEQHRQNCGRLFPWFAGELDQGCCRASCALGGGSGIWCPLWLEARRVVRRHEDAAAYSFLFCLERGGVELWRLRTCFLTQSCKGHLSQHIVVKF